MKPKIYYHIRQLKKYPYTINPRYDFDLNPSLDCRAEKREHAFLKMISAFKLHAEGYDAYIEQPVSTFIEKTKPHNLLILLQPDVFGIYLSYRSIKKLALVQCDVNKAPILRKNRWIDFRARSREMLPQSAKLRFIEARCTNQDRPERYTKNGIEYWLFPRHICDEFLDRIFSWVNPHARLDPKEIAGSIKGSRSQGG